MAAVARELGVNALINMSQMTVSQMSIQNITPSPQQRQHWLSANLSYSTIVPYFNRRFTDEDFCCRGNGSDRSSADRGITRQRTHTSCSDPFSRKSSGFNGTRH